MSRVGATVDPAIDFQRIAHTVAGLSVDCLPEAWSLDYSFGKNRRSRIEIQPRRVFCVVGEPGAGKSTLMDNLKRIFPEGVFNYQRMSQVMHERFPEERGTQSRGALCNDQLANGVLHSLVLEGKLSVPLCLDGFPRTLAQEEVLFSAFERCWSIPTIIALRLYSNDLAMQRMIDRRECGGEDRTDQDDAVLANRVKLFNELTLPAIEQARRRNRSDYLIEIDGRQTPEAVLSNLLLQFRDQGILRSR